MVVRFSVILAIASLFTFAATAVADEQAWEFPWPRNFIHFNVSVEKTDVDGYESNRLLLSSNAFTMGGGLSSVWSVVSGTTQSFQVRMIYRPSIKTWFYVFPKSKKLPVKNPKAFLVYAEGIQRKAERNKVTPVTFRKNKDGELVIYPEIRKRRNNIFDDPDQELTEEMLRLLRPTLFDSTYFQLFYDVERNGKKVGGSAIFVDLDPWVFCIGIEAEADDLSFFERSLNEFISAFYLEEGDSAAVEE